jgi:hypothetical protein
MIASYFGGRNTPTVSGFHGFFVRVHHKVATWVTLPFYQEQNQ